MGNLMCFYRKECCSLTFIPFHHIFIRIAEILSEPSLLENEQSQLSQPVLMSNSPAPRWACSSKSVSFLHWGALKWRIPPALSHQWETDMPGVIYPRSRIKLVIFTFLNFEIPPSQIFHPVEVPLNGSTTKLAVSYSSQFCITHKPAESALCSII